MFCSNCHKSNLDTNNFCIFCGQSLKERAININLPVGTKLNNGNFTIGKVLGQSNFTITYMGSDTNIKKPVVIKELFLKGICRHNNLVTIPEHFSNQIYDYTKQEFLKQFNILQQINHPNLIKINTCFEENNTAYIVIEYIKGNTLQEVIKEKDFLSEELAIYYIQKIGEGLQLVHQANLLHLDIKPDNILLTDDGDIVLIGFSAFKEYSEAKILMQKMASDPTQLFIPETLTEGYAAPEQYYINRKCGSYTDLYGLAATFYHIITKQIPISVLDRYKGQELIAPHHINSSISLTVSDILMKGLNLEENERFQSVEDFLKVFKHRKSETRQLNQINQINHLLEQEEPKNKPQNEPEINPVINTQSSNKNDQLDNSASQPTHEPRIEFIEQILQTITESNGNPQPLYQLLQENLDLLDDKLPQLLRNWAIPKLADSEPETEQIIATNFYALGEFLLFTFYQGNIFNIVEIAKTCFDIAGTVFTEVAFPEQSSHIQDQLYLVFLARVFATINIKQNLESGYSLLRDNQEKLNNRFVRVLREFGIAQLSEEALFANQKIVLQNFAQNIIAFGAIMTEFSEGDRKINLEIGVTCCEVATTFFNKSAFPPDWAIIQYCLGKIYSDYCHDFKENPLENLKLAQQYFQNALEIFSAPRFAEQRIETQKELDKVVSKLQELENINLEETNNLDTTEILESNLNCDEQEAQISEEKQIESVSDIKEIQDIEILSDEDDLDFILKDINLEDIDPEDAKLYQYTEEETAAFMDILLNTNDSDDITQKLTEMMMSKIFGGYSDITESINKKFDDWRKEYQLDFPESESLPSQNDPIFLAFKNNPEVRKILIIFLEKVFQKSSYVLEKQGKQDAVATIKEFINDIKNGEILANLPSNSESENITITSDNLSDANIIELFSDPDFQNLLEAVATEFTTILSTMDTDKYAPNDPVVLQKTLELLYKRMIPLIPQYVNPNSKFLNNPKIVKFLERYSTTPLASYGHQYNDFWRDIFKAITESEGNLQEFNLKEFVYPILTANLDKLNDFSAQYIYTFIKASYASPDSSDVEQLILISDHLTVLLLAFPHGNKAEKIEIAISFNLAALEVINPEIYPYEYAVIQTELAPCYHHRIKGDRAKNIEDAIKYYKEALKFFSKQKDLYFWAINLIHLGNAYQIRTWGVKADNIELAIKAYQKVLGEPEIKIKEPKLWGLAQMNLGYAYRERTKNISTWDDRENNFKDAITCYENALTIFTPETFPEYYVGCLNGIGLALAETQQKEEVNREKNAIAMLQNSLQHLNRENSPEQWGIIQMNLGIIHKEDKNWEQAINCFHNALQIFKRTTDPFNYIKIIGNLGWTYLEAKDFYNAYSKLALAIDTIESLRFDIVSGDKIKEDFSEKSSLFYQLIIKACLELGAKDPSYYDIAIEYIERSKSRSLVELLADRDILRKGNLPEDILNEYQKLRLEIAQEQRNLSNIASQIDAQSNFPQYNTPFKNVTPDYTKLNQLQKELDNLIDNEIYYIDPEFKLTQEVVPISFADIKKILPHNQTAIIEWYIPVPFDVFIGFLKGKKMSINDDFTMGGDGIYTFINTLEEQHPIVLKNSLENYLYFIDWFQEYWQNHENLKEWLEQEISPSPLEKLAQILEIDRIVDSIPDHIKKVIIIPHQFLHILPLHALPLKDGTCLIERFPEGLSYAPNCQILQFNQDKLGNNSRNFLAIQNPTENLQYTDIEVQTIQQYFQEPKPTILQGKQATKNDFLQQSLKDIDYLHLSCHGYFNGLMPLKSALLFADCHVSNLPTTGDLKSYLQLEDGSLIDLDKCLTLEAIFNLNLRKCKLVTLSACQTGLTNVNISVDEYIGIPSGFFYAGASYVVSSLWKVDDCSTAFLMIKFYQELFAQEGEKDVIKALREAQLWLRNRTKSELIKWLLKNKFAKFKKDLENDFSNTTFNHCPSEEKPFSNPYYWSGFCVIGK